MSEIQAELAAYRQERQQHSTSWSETSETLGPPVSSTVPPRGRGLAPTAPMQAQTKPSHSQPANVDGNSSSTTVTGAPKTTLVCYRCGDPGHFSRVCPNRQTRPGFKPEESRVSHLAGPSSPADVYIHANLNGCMVNCLLDTGAERSLIGRKLVPDVELEPTEVTLFAANDTPMPLLGWIGVTLGMGDVDVETDLIVVDNLEEIILGYDWMAQHGCCWDIPGGNITIDGRRYQLQRRPTKACVRRIYVDQEQIVQARHQTNVPVKMTCHSPYARSASWVTEPEAVGPGVVAARTLLADNPPYAAIRLINYSDKPVSLQKGLCLGTAVPAEICDPDKKLESEPKSSVPSGEFRRPFRIYSASVYCSAMTGDQSETEEMTGTSQNKSERNGTTAEEEALNDHLQPLIDALPADLEPDERRQAEQFIHENSSIFSRSEFDIGRTNLVHHQIDTGQHRPFRQSLRRHPVAYLPLIDQHVKDMLEHDIIEPAASPWCSNVVLVRKADGGLRFCIDYRQLNELTYKDTYPLPRIDMCLSALGDSRWFSTLDLRAGYWQTLI